MASDWIEQFETEGYVMFERLLPPDRVAHYVSIFDELVERAGSLRQSEDGFALELQADGTPVPGFLHKVQGVCVVEPRLVELTREPLIVERVAPLLEHPEEINVFGTKFFPKLPGGGTSTHWHQDNFYFDTTSHRVISCGIYLQEADGSNGCLRVVPGTHHEAVILPHEKEPGMIGSWVSGVEDGVVDLVMPPGSVALFSANLLHGSSDNHGVSSRYSTAWHYFPGDLELGQFKLGEYEDCHAVLV